MQMLLSTKVQESIAPYAFTPELVEVGAGKTHTFLVELSERRSVKCREWKIDLEYAYLHAKEACDAKVLDAPNLRQYVLRHQQIARTATLSP
jgi:plastocyanin